MKNTSDFNRGYAAALRDCTILEDDDDFQADSLAEALDDVTITIRDLEDILEVVSSARSRTYIDKGQNPNTKAICAHLNVIERLIFSAVDSLEGVKADIAKMEDLHWQEKKTASVTAITKGGRAEAQYILL